MQMLEKTVKFLKDSHVLVVGAGAGMGCDSGLPDFRGNEGFWNKYPPYRGKFNFYQCANPAFLQEHPHLFWGFYGSRLQMYRQKSPHIGFGYLKEIAHAMGGDKNSIFAVTSNVDGHFSKAGFADQLIYEVHGSIHHLQCSHCGIITPNQFQPNIDYEQMKCLNLPSCQRCGEISRPNILMFGDWEWADYRSEEQLTRYKQFQQETINKRITIVQIGCGTAIPTICSMMQQLYYSNKSAKYIRINPDQQHSYAKWLDGSRYLDLNMGAAEALTRIRQLYFKHD